MDGRRVAPSSAPARTCGTHVPTTRLCNRRNGRSVSYADGPRPRRLYRLDDGKKIAGVCTGIAAYADLDVGLVRALVVLAAFFTGFFLVFALYVGLMFLVPLARTSTEIAAAHGALRSAQRT